MEKTVLISGIAAFLITAVTVKLLIPLLTKLKFGQRILEIGPSWHMSKQGTPTMGGLAFIAVGVPICIILAFTADGGIDVRLIALAAYVFLNGLIGLLDDTVKLTRKQNEGLSAFSKFFLQMIIAAVFLVFLRAGRMVTTEIYIPFYGESIDIGRAYYPFALLFLVGFSNAVNLTDGLDGLCSSVTAAVALFLAVTAVRHAEYEGTVTSVVTVGVCLAFLLFNIHPAKVFMGDTGSLFLGSLVSATALLSGRGTLLFIVGAVYILEAASVILQVLYYKLTKKRLFLMAPFHHHLEKKGMKETSVTALFTAITLVCGAVAYLWG